MRRLIVIVMATGLAACSSDEYSDLKKELKTLSKDLRGKIEPLPVVKPYEPVPYTVFDQPDPFGPTKIELVVKAQPVGTGGPRPDMDRRKEPLETFPLESLKMVGIWRKGKDVFALVKADTTVYPVKVGNYLGANFGLVTAISDTQLNLRELVQDSGGDWTERKGALQLQELEARK